MSTDGGRDDFSSPARSDSIAVSAAFLVTSLPDVLNGSAAIAAIAAALPPASALNQCSATARAAGSAPRALGEPGGGVDGADEGGADEVPSRSSAIATSSSRRCILAAWFLSSKRRRRRSPPLFAVVGDTACGGTEMFEPEPGIPAAAPEPPPPGAVRPATGRGPSDGASGMAGL